MPPTQSARIERHLAAGSCVTFTVTSWMSDPLTFSQAQVSAARWTGASSASSLSRLFAPAYSRHPWPSGTCWARAWALSRVV